MMPEPMIKVMSDMLESVTRKLPVMWWMDKDATPKQLEQYPNAVTAKKIKDSKLYKAMK